VNDPAVRSASFSGGPIPWESHREWFARKLADPGCVFYIATDEHGEPLGQVRFDVSAGASEAVISVSLAPGQRGRGIGSEMIRGATVQFLGASNVQTVLALIKEGNLPSHRAFLRAGYAEDGSASESGCPASRLVFRKGPS
jgi:RimJ/RimL family protein N-acetyltransferase